MIEKRVSHGMLPQGIPLNDFILILGNYKPIHGGRLIINPLPDGAEVIEIYQDIER